MRPASADRRLFNETGHRPVCRMRSNRTVTAGASVIGALIFGANTLVRAAHSRTVKGPEVVRFIDSLLGADGACPTVIVLGNASIYHGIDEATRERWLPDHKALLFYLPPYSPELNMIEVAWR
ncbi:transposase [Burkholderia ubonensis]|uniref:transposase n=1 Tax=Burkholderia ubonensis TaxID=101571 RepID=UPI0012F741A8|nr:transposase [Burkholderia ubonensis]